jgi:5-methylcytosine-specific restriction endonuclease McrA
MKHSLWKKYNQDKMEGKCYVCEGVIDFPTFQASHVKASCNGGKTEIDNLRCCCWVCNNHMRTQDLYQYKKLFSIRD